MKTTVPQSKAIVPGQERGVKAEEGFGLSRVERVAETSITAAAAQAKAEVEAAYIVAINRPRNLMAVREKILDACKRPAFAAGAKYRKPVGKGFVVGPSIRFAEEALRAFGNVRVSCPTIFEDADIRVVRITVTDLESNLGYSDEVTLQKTVERREPRAGQEILGERTNSSGAKVYIIRATEDDFLTKLNAAKSKIIRNSGLRLVPSDIAEEAMRQVDASASGNSEDPAAERKKIADDFHGQNILVKELERYLGHGLDTATPVEVQQLRQLYEALRDGEANWGAVMEARRAELGGKLPTNGAAPAKPAKVQPTAADLRTRIQRAAKDKDPERVDSVLFQAGIEGTLNECQDVAILTAAAFAVEEMK